MKHILFEAIVRNRLTNGGLLGYIRTDVSFNDFEKRIVPMFMEAVRIWKDLMSYDPSQRNYVRPMQLLAKIVALEFSMSLFYRIGESATEIAQDEFHGIMEKMIADCHMECESNGVWGNPE